MLIAAVDPGKATGVATIDTDDLEGSFDARELQPEEFYAWLRLYALRSSAARPQLVSESFTITSQTGKNSQASWSLEHIGAMRYVVEEYGLPPLVLQSPAVGKGFGTDAKLRHMGWWRSGKGYAGHANDASRHLVTFLATRAKVLPTDTLVALSEL